MERTNSNCVVHVRQDSDTDLEALFHVVNPTTVPNSHPDTTPANSLPMRLRKLPPSFFKQPPIDGGLSPETDHPSGLQISHSRAHSSPASITVPSSLKGPPNHSLSSVVHQRSTSFDNTALLEEPAQMPPGWEIRSTPNGQHYFMNHFDQITTWQDPRKTQSTSNLNSAQTSASLPDGWEQAITPEGDIYYINHIERTTSWVDPRIALQCRSQENVRSSSIMPEMYRHRTIQLHRLQREREQLLKRQQELLKQEIKLKRDILEEGGTKSSLLGNLTREGLLPPHQDSTPVTNGGGHIRDQSFDSGLGMGGGNYHDIDMNESQPMFDANYNSKDSSYRTDASRRLPEILDSLPATNVDLGVMEGNDSSSNMDTDDLGVGLEFNSEMLNDVENFMSPGNKMSDNFLTWL
ncbi:Transcriptional coactivator YAP1 [Acropora cervicornis]|uniref:Transcriptional coactivator YAP1 n=1 Tax=Acropora cervicornis TaxID=6130 RepID=A0AAD9R5B7_ACRCE|nr:Transcriptional coactivator YAP1 [Acropora cervicornis]